MNFNYSAPQGYAIAQKGDWRRL